ncbi:MAG: DUF3369 domain-containing protein [Bacillota bacterium]
MRKILRESHQNYNIAVLDDEIGIIDSISVILKHSGYLFKGFTNQREAIESIRNDGCDLLILDYMMDGMHGDMVVEEVRKFNKEIYILLLTGHRDIAPPMETLRKLDIQGYCEKSDRFDQLILLIESAIKSIAQLKTIKKYRDGFSKILSAVPQIYQLQPVAIILENILEGILNIVDGKNAFILIDDTSIVNSRGSGSIFRGIGKYRVDLDMFMSMLDHSLMEQIGYVRTNGMTILHENSYILPMYSDNQHIVGVMYVDGGKSEEEKKLLEVYSRQAASAINNAFLHSLVNMKNEELEKTYDELRNRYIDIIEALRLAVDAKDSKTLGHSDRVAQYSLRIGEAMGIAEEELEHLRLGGMFHDIGKIGTSDNILSKPEIENDIYQEEMIVHTIKGSHILSAVSMFKEVVPIIKYHHERMDGKGYPDGLEGEGIPLLARIVAVADTLDDIIVKKYYGKSFEIDNVIEELLRVVGTKLDPLIVDVLIRELKEKPEFIKSS